MLQEEELFMERAESTPGSTQEPGGEGESTAEQGSRAGRRESVLLGLYKESSIYTLYPKLKFTSEFPLSIRR